MKYLCLAYGDEEKFNAMSKSQMDEGNGRFRLRFGEDDTSRPALRAGVRTGRFGRKREQRISDPRLYLCRSRLETVFY